MGGQMNAISTSGTRNVSAIVDEQLCGTAASDPSGAARKFKQHSRAQALFANLD